MALKIMENTHSDVKATFGIRLGFLKKNYNNKLSSRYVDFWTILFQLYDQGEPGLTFMRAFFLLI